MNSKLKDIHMDELFKGIMSLDSIEECYNCSIRVKFIVILFVKQVPARRPSVALISA